MEFGPVVRKGGGYDGIINRTFIDCFRGDMEYGVEEKCERDTVSG